MVSIFQFFYFFLFFFFNFNQNSQNTHVFIYFFKKNYKKFLRFRHRYFFSNFVKF
jgi:hypothetical protein